MNTNNPIGIPVYVFFVLFLLLASLLLTAEKAVEAVSQGDISLTTNTTQPGAKGSPSPTPVRIAMPGLGARVSVELLAPIEPVRALGHEYLLYELKLTNYYPAEVRLSRIEVFAGASNIDRLAEYSGKELQEMVAANPWSTKTPYLLAKGAQSVVFFTIPLEPGGPVPTEVWHRFEFEAETGNGKGTLELNSRPVSVAQKKPPVFEPPLRGSFWYAHSGPANNTHHRRTLAPRDGMLTMDQRFGIDFFLLNQLKDRDGRPYFVPDWKRTLKAEVYSVADGTVVKVVDGIPEEDFDTKTDSGIPVNWDTIGGNLVVIQIGSAQFVWYEHLKAGSIRVKEGDKVKAGQKLGVIGTSGNAGGAPHMHFEFTDSKVLGAGNGIPYVFSCFEMSSILADFPDWDELIQNDPLSLGTASGNLRKTDQDVRKMEIPLAGSIMSFPESGKCGE